MAVIVHGHLMAKEHADLKNSNKFYFKKVGLKHAMTKEEKTKNIKKIRICKKVIQMGWIFSVWSGAFLGKGG